MPRPEKQLPRDGDYVRFRIKGDKHLHSGKYTAVNGFEVCNSFICYTMACVDYWRPDHLPAAPGADLHELWKDVNE